MGRPSELAAVENEVEDDNDDDGVSPRMSEEGWWVVNLILVLCSTL